jgi:hypothetical protein
MFRADTYDLQIPVHVAGSEGFRKEIVSLCLSGKCFGRPIQDIFNPTCRRYETVAVEEHGGNRHHYPES